MPLSGTLDLGSRQSGTPTWAWDLLGGDSNHYLIVSTTGTGSNVVVAQAESLAIAKTISPASWATDLAGASLSGYDGTHVYTLSEAGIPVHGTAKFYTTGYRDDGLQSVLLRYIINADSTITVDGGVILTSTINNWLQPARCYAVNTIGSFTYAVLWNGEQNFSIGQYYLIKIPNSGTFSASALSSYVTEFQAQGYFESATGRRYLGRAAIVPRSGAIAIITYLGISEINNGPPGGSTLTTTGSEYWLVDPVAQVVITPLTDMQSLFGQPWADSGTTYAGTPSVLDRNDYGAPVINVVSGGYEIIFGRTFSDQLTTFRFRRYFMNSSTGAISYVDTTNQTITGPLAQADTVYAPRESGDLLLAATDTEFWYFGQVALAAPGVPPPSPYFIERMTPLFDDNIPDNQHFFVDSGIVPPSARLATFAGDGFDGIRCYGMDLLTGAGATQLVGVLNGMDIGDSIAAANGVVDFAFNSTFTLIYVQSVGAVTFPQVFLDQYQVAIDSGTQDGSSHELYYVMPFIVGFPYTSQGQLLRPNHGTDAGARSGPAMGKIRRNHWYAALLYRTQGDLTFSTDFTNLHPAELVPYGDSVTTAQPNLFSGTITTTIDDDYSLDGMIAFQMTRPLPCTLVSISGYIETQDK